MNTFQWPPDKTDEELLQIHTHVKDYQLTHGSIVKLVQTDSERGPLARPIGVTMFPTKFPRPLFEQALRIQHLYNELYARVAEDRSWLRSVLEGLIASDPLTKTLWDIHSDIDRVGYAQIISLGIFRSDYMLDATRGTEDFSVDSGSELKQVELNTFSCAGGIHGNIATGMHRYLAASGHYSTEASPLHSTYIQTNNTLQGIISALALGHSTYASSYTDIKHPLAILMVVQPRNVNIADERPIEYGLYSRDPMIPCFRCVWDDDMSERFRIAAPEPKLLYTHPTQHPRQIYEISVVYMRAGYDVREYTAPGRLIRTTLERSRAIKCSSILSHLSTYKIVQQALAEPGALERFLPADSAALLRPTFAKMYVLDPDTEDGSHAISLALNPDTAEQYILKPSLEGGGHNIYGRAIPAFLDSISNELWPNYVLMARIEPPEDVQNILLSPQGVYRGEVVSELGVFGAVLWRMSKERKDKSVEILENRGAMGWSLKTKARHVDEMSVIKGYGCFDSPLLV